MSRAVASELVRRAACEPLYDLDPQTGASIEVFYADQVLAASFGTRPGWFWWASRAGLPPNDLPKGPFATSYLAYRDATTRWMVTGRNRDCS